VLIGETTTVSEAATERLGSALGAALPRSPGMPVILCLEGGLGSGKTVLARGVMRGLGVCGEVRSPTFTLAIPHRGRLAVTHVDLYRLDRARAVETLPWDDWLIDDGVVIVEWGERARHLLGDDRFDVGLAHRGESLRQIRMTASGGAAERLGEMLRAAFTRAVRADPAGIDGEPADAGRTGSPRDGPAARGA